jgi:predicted HTH domain antitoxin
MQTIQIDISKDDYNEINKTETELHSDFKIALAIWYYLNEYFSLARAARFAGLSRHDFETLLANKQIPISLQNLEDIQDDLNNFNDE